jgi:hypothetical protein
MESRTAKEWLCKGKKRISSWEITKGEERNGQKHHEETLSYFDKAIELSNDNKEIKTQAWYYKGEKWRLMFVLPAWDENCCYNEAIKCYDEAIKLDKSYAPAWYAKGFVIEELGKDDEAIKCYDKAIELDKENDQYKVTKADILFKIKKDKDAVDLLLKTKLDLLEKLSYLENKGGFFDYLIRSKDFEDSFFRTIMEENRIADSNAKNKYREIYARSLLLISYLFISGESVAHYTTKSVAQKLLFDKSNFRLNLSILSNDTKEGRILLDYLELPREYQRSTPTEQSIFLFGHSFIESVGNNKNTIGESYGAFIGCFSFNTDCLNQYRLYGKDNHKEGTGVSLVLNESFFNSTPKMPISHSNSHNSLYRCIYFDLETGRVVSVGHQEEYIHTKENNNIYWPNGQGDVGINALLNGNDSVKEPDRNYTERINTLIDIVQKEFDTLKEKIKEEGIDKSIISQLLLNLRYLIKDVAFKEEQECRIIQIMLITDDKIKESDDYNQLYIETDLGNSPFCIKKIVFGPKATGINLFQDILRRKNLNISCEQSKLPLA